MGPGGQREESELTCGPGLSARGRERLRGDTGCCGKRAARAGLLRCVGSGQLGRGGVLAGLESAACERPAGGVQWKGRSDARGRGEKRAVAGRAGDGASWAAVLGRRERKEGKMAWAGLG